MLLYLIRRLGYPLEGSDPGKDICAYLLSTTHPDVTVEIVIRHDLSFGLALRRDSDLMNKYSGPFPTAREQAVREVTTTLQTFCKELQRPVALRSLGLCPSGSGPKPTDCAPIFHRAGDGVPEAWPGGVI